MPGNFHFDFIAPFYERVLHPAAPQELIARLALPAAGALLDAGGGTGRIAQFLRGSAQPVVVADSSLKMLAQARAKPGLNPTAGLSESLPFPAGGFARIIMVDALHHVCDQRRTAAELWRVLRPGGRLVIEEPDVGTLAVKFLAAAERLMLMRSRFLPPAAIAGLFRHPDARVTIERASGQAWIIVEKSAAPG
jgi:ubiquinone/menaquinone biosynthesis C-methylase UbiE